MSEVADLLDEYERRMFEFSGFSFRVPWGHSPQRLAERLGADLWESIADELRIGVEDIPREVIDYYAWCSTKVLATDGAWDIKKYRMLFFPGWDYMPPSVAKAYNPADTSFPDMEAPFEDTGTDNWQLNGQGLYLFHIDSPYIVLSTRASDAGSLWLRDERHGKLFGSISEMVRFYISLFDRGMYMIDYPNPNNVYAVNFNDRMDELIGEGMRRRRFAAHSGFDPSDEDDLWHLDGEASVYPPFEW